MGNGEQVQEGVVMGKVHSDHVTTRVLDQDSGIFRFALPETAPLLEVLTTGAAQASVTLLPNATEPLDQLHNLGSHDEVGLAIEDLQEPLGEYLKKQHTTRDFGIELRRVFRVNNRFAVAGEPMLSPRQILGLVGLKVEEYSLYRANSADLLALDAPVAVNRGNVFEAQRDGRYGKEYWIYAPQED